MTRQKENTWGKIIQTDFPRESKRRSWKVGALEKCLDIVFQRMIDACVNPK